MKSALAAASVAALTAVGVAGAAPWHAALVLAGDSDLWQLSRRIYAGALAAPGLSGLVLLDGPARFGPPRLACLGEGRSPVTLLPPQNTGAPGTLRRVVDHVPAGGFGLLVLAGHGRPPVVRGDGRLRPGGLLVDWGAGGDGLTPRELAQVVAGRRWDVAMLLACHSAALETLWALRGHVRLAVAVAGEVRATGDEVAAALQRVGDGARPRAVAEALASALAREARPEGHVPGAVVIVDVGRLEGGVRALSSLSDMAIADSEVWRKALAAASTMVVPLDRAGLSVDVGSLCQALSALLPRSAADAAAQAGDAARHAVLAAWWAAGRQAHASGLEIAMPSAQLVDVENMADEVPLWGRIGWLRLAAAGGKESSMTGGCQRMRRCEAQAATGGGS